MSAIEDIEDLAANIFDSEGPVDDRQLVHGQKMLKRQLRKEKIKRKAEQQAEESTSEQEQNETEVDFRTG